ncbi:MAG: glycosyltransferase [Proteobacteria bacterium]|nr:glycosyltransferase [Pseudomonadota bacterium]
MKILYVSSHDLVGQQFNGYLLLNAMRKMDIDARMYVHHFQVNKPDVIYHMNNPIAFFLNRVLSRLGKLLSLHAILPIHSVDIMKNSFYKEADIVHLQLIHATPFFSLLSLPRMGRQKKLVLTLHDPWMLTGHCIHPIECERWKHGCGACPDLKRPFSIKNDTTALIWKIKQMVMQRTNVHLVVASSWMEQMAVKSQILSHLPHSIIPFGLDTQVFKPLDKKACKQAFGIPEDSFVVAFRSVPFSPFKGVEYIEKALLNLSSKKPIYIITLDAVGLVPNLDKKFKIIELGWVNERFMALALSAADLFLMPSIAEAFGMMAVESMACGTPVIVFEGTALPGVIQAPRGGIAVPSKNWEALKEAIETLIENTELYGNLVRNGLEIVNEEYTIEKYVARHLDLYNQLIAL